MGCKFLSYDIDLGELCPGTENVRAGVDGEKKSDSTNFKSLSWWWWCWGWWGRWWWRTSWWFGTVHDTTGHQCLNCKLNNSRKKYNYTEHIFACWYFACAPVGSCSSGGSLEVLRTRLRPEAAEHWGAQQTEKYISYRNWYRSILSYYRQWHSDCNVF